MKDFKNATDQELPADEVFGANDVWILVGVVLSIIGNGEVGKVGEVVLQLMPTGLDLLCQEVLLVEEEDDGDGLQPSIVPDGLEEGQGLFESILGWILPEDHVEG